MFVWPCWEEVSGQWQLVWYVWEGERAISVGFPTARGALQALDARLRERGLGGRQALEVLRVERGRIARVTVKIRNGTFRPGERPVSVTPDPSEDEAGLGHPSR